MWSAAAGMAAFGLLLVASGSAGTRSRDPDQQRPVHELVEPAQDAGRGGLVRFRKHDRRHLPDRPLHQRRREQPRLVDFDERWPDVDDGHASGHDCLPGWAVGAHERPRRRLRPRARRLDDLGPCHRRVGQRCSRPDQPLDRRRPHLAEPGHGRHCAGDLLRQELDRLRHLGCRALTTATATRNGKTPAPAPRS